MNSDQQEEVGIGRGRGRGRILQPPPAPNIYRTVPGPIPSSFGGGRGRGMPPPPQIESQGTNDETSKRAVEYTLVGTVKIPSWLRTPQQLESDRLKLQVEEQKRRRLFNKKFENKPKRYEMPRMPRCPRKDFHDD